MLVNRTYVKFICAPLFMLFMNGCANSQINSDREALVNAGRGAVNIIITNIKSYSNEIYLEISFFTNL